MHGLGIWPDVPMSTVVSRHGCQHGIHVGPGHVQSDTSKLKAPSCFCCLKQTKGRRGGEPGMGCSTMNTSLLVLFLTVPFFLFPPFAAQFSFFSPFFLSLSAVLLNKATTTVFTFHFFVTYCYFFAWLSMLTLGSRQSPNLFQVSLSRIGWALCVCNSIYVGTLQLKMVNFYLIFNYLQQLNKG